MKKFRIIINVIFMTIMIILSTIQLSEEKYNYFNNNQIIDIKVNKDNKIEFKYFHTDNHNLDKYIYTNLDVINLKKGFISTINKKDENQVGTINSFNIMGDVSIYDFNEIVNYSLNGNYIIKGDLANKEKFLNELKENKFDVNEENQISKSVNINYKLIFIIYFLFILFMIQIMYFISRTKLFMIKKSLGFSYFRILKEEIFIYLKDMILIISCSTLISSIILYSLNSNIINLLKYTIIKDLIDVIIIFSIIFLISSMFSMLIVNIKNLKGHNHYKILYTIINIYKFIFLIITIICIIFSMNVYNSISYEKDNGEIIIKKANNLATPLIISNGDVTQKSYDYRNTMNLELFKKLISNNVFGTSANDFSKGLEDRWDENLYGPKIFQVTENYFIYNPIELIDGIDINNVLNSNDLYLLLPEKFKEQESNIIDKKFNYIKDKEALNNLKILYYKNNTKFYPFSKEDIVTTNSYLIDPVISIIDNDYIMSLNKDNYNNELDPYFYQTNNIIGNGFYYYESNNENPYNTIKNINLEVYKENKEYAKIVGAEYIISTINNKISYYTNILILLLIFIIINIILVMINILFNTKIYYLINQEKIIIKKTFGFSYFKIIANIIKNKLIIYSAIYVLLLIIGIYLKLNILLITFILSMLISMDIILIIIYLKNLVNKNKLNVIKGDK